MTKKISKSDMPVDEIERAIYAAAFVAAMKDFGRHGDTPTEERWGYANEARRIAINAVAWHRLLAATM